VKRSTRLPGCDGAVGLARTATRVVGVERDDCIQCRVELLDPTELRFDNFSRGQLTYANGTSHF
jgi:hypothetical protein